jgi:coenzyme F420-reducing hydrogenase alpha subunit
MQHHNFDVDIVIPSSKQKVKITAEAIEVNQTRIACGDVAAVKYGVSLIGPVKKPTKKKYTIDVKSKDGKTVSVQFESSKVEELLEEDHTYYYVMSGLWQYVKKHLVNEFIEKLNNKEKLEVGAAKFDYQGFEVSYKTWFLGKTKTAILPWSQIKYFLDKGILHVQDMYDKKKNINVSLHNDWNAVVLNTLLHYLSQEHRKEKLEKGEKI